MDQYIAEFIGDYSVHIAEFIDEYRMYIAEFTGTAILVLLGNGVVANVLLEKTKGHGAGWIVIAFIALIFVIVVHLR